MEVRHAGIVCINLAKSIEFFTKWFGCQILREMDESGPFISTILKHPNTRVKTVKLKPPKGDTLIELLEFMDPKPEATKHSLFGYGLSHIALTVDNLDTLYDKMSNENVPFLSTPQQSEDGLAKVCFCKDPNGIYLELVEMIGTQ